MRFALSRISFARLLQYGLLFAALFVEIGSPTTNASANDNGSSHPPADASVCGGEHIDPVQIVCHLPPPDRRRFIFLIDASGSMIPTMQFIRSELQRVIQHLGSEQQFQIVFFTGSGIGALPSGEENTSWQYATAENKQTTCNWLQANPPEFYAHGPGSLFLIEALTQVLEDEPSSIYFFSDAPTGHGRHEVEQTLIMETIAAVNNPDHPTKIHCLHLLSPDPLTEIGMQATLERIAEETGGVYRFFHARELGLR